MNTLYLDIETYKTQRPEFAARLVEGITAPSNYKDPEKIERYIAEKWVEVVNRTSLNGTWGTIIAVGFLADGMTKPDVLLRKPDRSEGDFLLGTWERIKKATNGEWNPYFVGHNITFDLRFLWQRCIANRVQPPMRLLPNDSPWSNTYFDTMQEWAGYKNTISLGDLCFALGIEHDDSFTGADVGKAYEDGDYDLIVDHCRADIEATRRVHRVLTFTD